MTADSEPAMDFAEQMSEKHGMEAHARNHPPDSERLGELRGLLDYLQECDPDTLGDKDARFKIESLFASLSDDLVKMREENERLNEELDDSIDRYAGVCVSCKSLAVIMGVCRGCGFRQREAPDLIEKLRSQALTPEEAAMLLATPIERFKYPITEATIEKLRRVTSGAKTE